MDKCAHKDAGFTLVELMTVLVIIGLMASAVVMTLPRDKPAIEAQVTDLLQSLNGGAQASIITGRAHGWGLTKEQAQLFEFVEGEWTPVQEMNWADDVSVEFRKNDAAVKLGDEIIPIVIFEPTGLSTEFELVLSDGQRTRRLLSRGDGRVILEDGS